MGVKWTKEQEKVITLRDRNILVAAAAGSGKTAVLVERIIQRLMDTKEKMDVDRLLIVTFTEAAAAEMRERIRMAIEKTLEEQPQNVHLQRQATLIHSAPITTIHSFCLSVIREHFHILNIDPGFRIVEEGELKLLKQDVLEKLLETCYEVGEGSFLDFVEKYGTGKNDKKIEDIIITLYDYSRSYPQPDRWLQQCIQSYGQREHESMADGPCIKRVLELAFQKAEDALSILREGLTICEMPDGPYMYSEMLESDKAFLERLLKERSFGGLYQALEEVEWKRLSTKKDSSVDGEKRGNVKALREKAKKIVKDMIAMYFYEEPAEILNDMSKSQETIEVLVHLVKQFAKAFGEKKQSKNMIDFSDMEQLALAILTREEEGYLVPSQVAAEYQGQFLEVMIDEYQDSNLIQEAILTSVSTVSKGKYNVFMVGDVKQSIYRFRLSRPELFMEKYDTYSLDEGKRQRINLHKNFRSREEVLSVVNFIFEHIMQKSLGGISYDEQAALYPGASYEAVRDTLGNSLYQAELILVDTSKDKDTELGSVQESEQESGREQEARAVARRIKELLKNGRVTDGETGERRLPTYKDIVILTRSSKGWADVFGRVLDQEGVPACAESREGYFETYEVSILLSYLKVLDNFRQELPLTAVLTSPFAELDAQKLAKIRNAFPGIPFYEAVSQYAQGENCKGELQEALQEILVTIEDFRRMVPYVAIHDLLRHIIEETGFGIYIAAMPGGAQRMANVDMLVEKAAVFGDTSYKGLFNFVRYIEQLKKYNVDYGEVNIRDEQSDTVRILTIHKSKGLEFPIVFVCGLGKQFNTQDVKGSTVIHPEWGVGLDAIDLDRRTKIPTILKKVIQEEITRENLGEELRVLYVALTRAKEKLIMTGQLPKALEILEKYNLAGETEKKNEREALPYYILAKARTCLDWLLPLLPRLTGDVPLRVYVDEGKEADTGAFVEAQAEVLARGVLEHWSTETIYHEALHDRLPRQLKYTYPYEQQGSLKMKFTVSELKKRVSLSDEGGVSLYDEPETVPLLPQFLKGKTELSGASRGSAYHKLLELLDFAGEYDTKALQEEIARFKIEGKLSDEMADCISTSDILLFLQSRSGCRMHKAAISNLLKKEQPFVLSVNAGEVYPDLDSTEDILVQGIIDVYFEEDGQLVVLDYKTDKVSESLELKEKYHAQLDYYAKALEQLLGKKVKEKIIYSFTLGEEMQV